MPTSDEQLIALRRLQELQGAGPSKLDSFIEGAKKVGEDAVSGFGRGAAGLLQQSEASATGQVPKTFLNEIGDRAQQYYSDRSNTTGQEPGYGKSLVQGASGALVSPIGSKAKGAKALIGTLLSGASAAGAGEAANRAMPDSPIMQKIAGLLGGVAGGFVGGPRQSVAKTDIRRALEGMTPEQFAEAERNAQRFNSVGSTTATAAEAFPPNSGIMALATKARNGPLDNALRERTTLRPEDLQALGETSMGRVGPAVDSNSVANTVAGAATGHLEGNKQLATNAMTNRLAGEMANPYRVMALRRDLQQLATMQDRPNVRDAFNEVGDSLVSARSRNPNAPQPIVPVQELSFALKSMKDRANNPLAQNQGGKSITGSDYAGAISAAELGLGDISPAFAGANSDFRAFKNQVDLPTRQGPIGSLADKNPLLAGQTPVARLEGLISGNSPQTVGGVARVLESPALTNGQPASARDMARALMQQRLKDGSTNPGQAVRGLPGSQTEQNLSALIDAGGGNSAHTLEPLAVADQLQAFAKPAGINEIPRMGLSNLVRPFRTADMMLSRQTEHSVQREIAALLADPSPEGMRKLQDAYMFNPDIRRALSAVAAVNSTQGESK